MTNRQKKELWVRDAVEITDALIKHANGRFLCPLCLEWFSDLDDLTLEHAPPRSVGGRHIAVTCRDCNSSSGYGIDAALHWTERVREFGAGHMTKSMPMTFSIDGIEQHVEAIFDADGLRVGGVPAQNHPDVAPEIEQRLKAMSDGGPNYEMSLSFKTPNTRAASIAWLRAGFLAGFALYGYIWALRISDVNDVRRQILEPDEKILERYCLITDQNTQREQLIGIVERPGELVSVLALTNGCAIFLPSGAGTYNRLHQLHEWPPVGLKEFTGQFGPWPARPMYSFDRWTLDGPRAGGDANRTESVEEHKLANASDAGGAASSADA